MRTTTPIAPALLAALGLMLSACADMGHPYWTELPSTPSPEEVEAEAFLQQEAGPVV